MSPFFKICWPYTLLMKKNPLKIDYVTSPWSNLPMLLALVDLILDTWNISPAATKTRACCASAAWRYLACHCMHCMKTMIMTLAHTAIRTSKPRSQDNHESDWFCSRICSVSPRQKNGHLYGLFLHSSKFNLRDSQKENLNFWHFFLRANLFGQNKQYLLEKITNVLRKWNQKFSLKGTVFNNPKKLVVEFFFSSNYLCLLKQGVFNFIL